MVVLTLSRPVRLKTPPWICTVCTPEMSAGPEAIVGEHSAGTGPSSAFHVLFFPFFLEDLEPLPLLSELPFIARLWTCGEKKVRKQDLKPTIVIIADGLMDLRG
jgi:hypothetical protein